MSVSSSRREFMRALVGISLSTSALGVGCAQNKRARVEGRLLGQQVEQGHRLRGDLREHLAQGLTQPKVEADVVIVGAGPAGLSAAYELGKLGKRKVLILELEGEVGGTSLSGTSPTSAYPWAAHYVPVPSRDNPDLTALLRDMGVVEGFHATGRPQVREPYLVRVPDERLFYKGYWYSGLYLHAGESAEDRRQLQLFEAEVAKAVALRDAAGKRAFAIPTAQASRDPMLTALDRLSATQWLAARGLHSTRLLWLLDYACRDDYGTRLSDTSAWALLLYFAARIETPDAEPADIITWPEGNGALTRHLAQHSQAQLHTSELVLDVSPTEGGVRVLGFDYKRKVHTHYQAKQVIVAVPHFIARRIVAPLRERGLGDDGFEYAPWIVANLHLKERPEERGVPPAWDNVLYDSPSLGYVTATHQRGSDVGPSVWTYYLPLAHVDAKTEREQLLRGQFEDYRDAILADLTRAHPNLPEVVDRLDVFRWGHAMVKPRPGFLTNPARLLAQQSLGAIHFAHTDLSGLALFEEAFDHGLRVARKVHAELSA